MFAYWGEVAALATAVCWTATAAFFSYSGRIVGSNVVNRIRLVWAFIFLSLSHWALEGSLFPTQVEGFRWFWLSISSILGLVLGDTFLFQAYVLLGARLTTLLMATVPIIGLLFGWLLFGETVTGLELAGVMLTVTAVTWVVTEQQAEQTDSEKRNFKRGIWFGIGGAVGQVLNLVTARYGLVGQFSTISATVIRIFVALVILWAIAAWQKQLRHTFQQWRNKQAAPAIIAGSIFGPFLGIWLSIIAIQLTRLGIASTLMALSPIMIIPIDIFVFKKRVSVRGIVGSLIAIAGVALIFLPQS